MATGQLTSSTEVVSALVAMGRILDRRVEAVVAELGLTVDSWRVIDLVVRAPGRSMRELSGELALPPATATRMVDQLVSVGLTYRAVAPEDRRCVILHPTDEGRTVARAARRRVVAVEQEVLTSLRKLDVDPGALLAALGDLAPRG